DDPKLAVFRNSNLFLAPSRDPFGTVVRYDQEPLLCGYVHEENLGRIADSASLVAERRGKGCVIAFVDNPNFRAFWYGTNKLYLNALFFAQAIEDTRSKEVDDEHEQH
ncbi:MAG: zinc carboxypeptidase, partial [Verrucomicrobiota bacterium]